MTGLGINEMLRSEGGGGIPEDPTFLLGTRVPYYPTQKMKDNLLGGRGSWACLSLGWLCMGMGLRREDEAEAFSQRMRLLWREERRRTDSCATWGIGTDREEARKAECKGNGSKVSEKPGETECQEDDQE